MLDWQSDDDEEPSPPLDWRRAAVRWAVVAAVAALLLFEGVRAWQTIADLRAGRDLVDSAEARLQQDRLDTRPSDAQRSESEFLRAQGRFESASSRLRGDALVRVARHVPFLGSQLDAAVEFSDIGANASYVGTESARAIVAFDAIRSAESGATFPERTMTAIELLDPYVTNIQSSLRRVDAAHARVYRESLMPPLRSALRDMARREAELVEVLQAYGRGRELAPSFLGFEGPRTYLVLAHNNAELLPTGGLISVVGTIRLNEGRVEEMDFRDAVSFSEDWLVSSGVYIEPPRPLQQYLLKTSGLSLATSNWSPDFPTSSRAAVYFYALAGGGPVDGVIGINIRTLEELMKLTGPIEMPEFGITVEAHNAFDLTEENTRAPYEPTGDRKEFAALLANRVLDRVLRPEQGQWSPLVDTLDTLGDEEDLLLFSFDEEEQAIIESFGWDGGIRREYGDYLMVVDASVNSTKLNAVLEQTMDVQVAFDASGAATSTVDLTYFNNLAPWAATRDPDLVELLMLGGLYGGYVRLFVPAASQIERVDDAQGEIGLEEAGVEFGLTVFGRFFAVPRDQTRSVSFTYRTPSMLIPTEDGWLYTLTLKKQAGRAIEAVDVTVEPPPGGRLATVTLDGEPVRSAGVTRIDLTRDRVLSYTFEK